MRDFCKYLLFGIAGLILSLAFPRLRVDWFAIVLTFALLGSEKKISAWSLLFVLAFLYGAFSLAAPWTLVLPSAFGAGVFFALRRNFSFTPFSSRVCLLLALWTAPVLFWLLATALRGGGWTLGWEEGFGLASTLAVGLWLLPALSYALARLWQRLRIFGGAAGRVDLSRADWISARGARILRKPFGLEKGL